jgi:hypothetical protein
MLSKIPKTLQHWRGLQEWGKAGILDSQIENPAKNEKATAKPRSGCDSGCRGFESHRHPIFWHS